MTTTPSVADVLGGPATGEPGVFPDQIKLAINTTVRHHLNHMPDPVIRPGGWPFASWFPTGAPQAADRHDFAPSELSLEVTAGDRACRRSVSRWTCRWTLTNTSGVVAARAERRQHRGAVRIDHGGRRRRTRASGAAVRDHLRARQGRASSSLARASRRRPRCSGARPASPSSRPGRYRVNVAVSWSAQGVPVGVREWRRRVRRLPDERCRQHTRPVS